MRRPGVLLVAALVAATAGCGGSGSESSGGPVTVFAASSLTDAFGAIGDSFAASRGDRATFSFAGSQELVSQIGNGAPADVIATADTTTMASVAGDLAAPASTFAHNRLVIVTAPGNPKHITALGDLGRPGVTVILADPSVPAGKYAATALAAAHVTVHPLSLELDVRAVLTKVEIGEADAGIVYATDAQSAGAKVATVAVDGAPEATYQIGALDARGKAFVDYVLSAAGQAVLHRYGFLPP